MINFFALCLVLTSLLTAQVWSPSPAGNQQNEKEDVIVKGHRVIVVETYDEHGHRNTKVSISPPQDPLAAPDGGFIQDAKEKVNQAANVLPNLGQGVTSADFKYHHKPGGEAHGPGELICDALGKCRHKIARVISGTKDQVSEFAHEAKKVAEEAIHKRKEIAHEATEKVEDAYEKAKEKATQKAHDAKEAVEDAYEKAMDSAKELTQKAKDTAKSAKDIAKTIGLDAAGNVSVQAGKEKARTEEARNRIWEAFKHMGSTEGINSMMGVLNLLGFASAYGMCMWVTFISSHVLAGSLTRNQFAMVQSKIYPVYFRAMAYCIVLALLGHMVGHRKLLFSGRKAEILQVHNFLASLMVVLINAFYLEPSATKVMFEKLRIEKEEGRGRESQAAETRRAEDPVSGIRAATTTATATAGGQAATEAENREQEEIRSKLVRMNERLKRLNTCSSFLNMLTLMALTWHLVYLGQCIYRNC